MEKLIATAQTFEARRLCRVIGAVFALILVVQAVLHLGAVGAGRPYENWDEIATFNTAHEITGPRAERIYGPLDTFMQWGAIKFYAAFDPVGRAHENPRYSNNYPKSWSDPNAVLQTLQEWPGKYFRGMDDRQPIFTSRYIHVAFAYLLVGVIGAMVICAYGAPAAFILVPLLCLTAGQEIYFQTTQSLPNAINAILSFAVGVFAMIYADRQRPVFLYASVVALVIGFNFKFDIILMAAAPGLAVLLMAATVNFRDALRAALIAAGIGLVVLVLTCPYLVFDPVMMLRQYYHGLSGTAPAGMTADQVQANIEQLLYVLKTNVAVSGLGNVAGIIAVALCLVAAFAVSALRRDRMAVLLSATALLALFCWFVIASRLPNASPRHFVNGLGVFFAVLGMTVILAARQPRPVGLVAGALLALFSVQYIANASIASASSVSAWRAANSAQGHDPAHNRVRAALATVELMRTGKYGPVVLVDQHAYIDLRILRSHGIRTQYINLANAGDTGPKFSGPHLVLFSRGTYDKRQGYYRAWMGDWQDDMKRDYTAYQARLTALPVVRRFAGPAQNVLSIAPVNATDEIHISVLNGR